MARSFNGSTQYLVHNAALVTAPPFTLACRFRAASATTTGELMAVSNSALDTHYFRMLLISGVVSAIHRCNPSGGPTVQGVAQATASIGDTNWHTAVATFGSTSSRAAYVDGANKGTNTTLVADTMSLDRTTIGVLLRPSTELWFNGSICEAAIWSVALSDAEAAMVASRRTIRSVRPDALIHFWDLFGRLSPEPDRFGGAAMSLTNAPTVADHPPIIYPVESRRRRALSRDPSPKTRRGHAVTIDTSIGEMGSVFAERNVLHADESSAGVSIFPDISGQSSHWLCVLMYSRLPPDATPVGMQVTVKHRYVDSPDHMVSMSSVKAKAIKGGSLVGDELTLDGVPSLADDWAESSAGGATELWGTTWDADDWNATDSNGKPTSGVALRWITNNSSPDQYGAIDVEHVRITRWYSLPSGEIVVDHTGILMRHILAGAL